MKKIVLSFLYIFPPLFSMDQEGAHYGRLLSESAQRIKEKAQEVSTAWERLKHSQGHKVSLRTHIEKAIKGEDYITYPVAPEVVQASKLTDELEDTTKVNGQTPKNAVYIPFVQTSDLVSLPSSSTSLSPMFSSVIPPSSLPVNEGETVGWQFHAFGAEKIREEKKERSHFEESSTSATTLRAHKRNSLESPLENTVYRSYNLGEKINYSNNYALLTVEEQQEDISLDPQKLRVWKIDEEISWQNRRCKELIRDGGKCLFKKLIEFYKEDTKLLYFLKHSLIVLAAVQLPWTTDPLVTYTPIYLAIHLTPLVLKSLFAIPHIIRNSSYIADKFRYEYAKDRYWVLCKVLGKSDKRIAQFEQSLSKKNERNLNELYQGGILTYQGGTNM